MKIPNKNFMSRIELNLFRSFDEDLKAIWTKLESSGECYVFQRLSWLMHWQQTIGAAHGIEPLIFVAFENKEPVAVFPLCLHRFFKVRVVKFLGGEQADYNAPIFLANRLTADEFFGVWKAVLELLPVHDVRDLTRIPEKLSNCNNFLLFDVDDKKIDGIAYSANLFPSWADFERHLSRKLLKDNARMIRRLSEIGDVEILESNSEAQFQNIIKVTFLQKTRRYLETGVRNILSSSSVRAFYSGLYAAITGEPKVHLSALIVGDRILATHLGVYDRGRYYYLFPSFDSGALSKYSPGRLLSEYLVKSAIQKGLNVFDFTVGGEAYKQQWCDSEMRLYRILEANTLQGKIYIWSQSFVSWVKKNHHTRQMVLRAKRLIRRNRGKNEL